MKTLLLMSLGLVILFATIIQAKSKCRCHVGQEPLGLPKTRECCIRANGNFDATNQLCNPGDANQYQQFQDCCLYNSLEGRLCLIIVLINVVLLNVSIM
ncbi:hypothetical protein BDA99DRAFT_493078 [Phascolomyces articulosus]|uniref:Uncharacterized protein n=1 Tax=Phascolomyces articulosus TaxID=60185 RepID=A0AAD5PL60_9FUNG|nr:hypothetical protein BDA99DRAFT_493078 [Phascolomyces articulosus]